MLDLLDRADDPFSRRLFDPGHVTASAVVVDSGWHAVLLVHHRRLKQWLQPGGHVEPTDADIVATARREVLEETGIRVAPPASNAAPVVGLDVHFIPARPGEAAHYHHDVCFLFVAEETTISNSGEVNDAVWCPPDRLDDYRIDAPLRRACRTVRSLAPPAALVTFPRF